ncbi:MAG TPA: P-loop NTPase [Pirellulales bacterium]|jgi:flagellar biosynthesis protein FlhG|nr:P-loop NTPase [Pirellulales bacterium]
MMFDQASRLRLLMFDGPSPGATVGGSAPRLVVVTGAKGGVGTTTVAVNLAVALALDGRRTVLVDADLGRADVAALCGAGDGYTVADVLAGRLSVHEALVRGPAGILVLPGAWATGHVSECSTAALERLLSELSRLGPHAEFVVLDAGNGQHRVVRRFWQAAHSVLFVTSSDEPAVMNTYAAIKLLAAEGARPQLHTLVNLSVDAAAASDTQARLTRACRRFLGLTLCEGESVPLDGQVVAAGRQKTPFLLESPDCAAARPLENLAEALAADVRSGQRIASGSA